MLKKQTVWLLTMLSLMIVLSVYYMTSKNDEFAYIDKGKDDSGEVASDSADINDEAETKVDDARNLGRDELFTTLRMEIQEKRSLTKDRLESIVTSSTASIDEKNKALEDIDQLDDISAKESILEESIIA